jgi:osmotically inducible lipoprotein OsmB
VFRRTEIVAVVDHNGLSPVAALMALHDFVYFTSLGEFVMNINKRLPLVLPAVLLASVLGLGACSGMTRQEQGTATGAVIGGTAGAVMGGGVLGTAAGAVVGGVVGKEVTKPK